MAKSIAQQTIENAVVLKDQPLYYSRLLSSGTIPAGDIKFFTQVVGSTEDSISLSDYETNSTFPGALPEGEVFELHGFSIRLHNVSGVSLADTKKIMNSRSVFIFRIAQNEWYKRPLSDFPCTNGITGMSTTSDTDIINIGIPYVKNYLKLKRPIRLPEKRPFDVIIRVCTAFTIESNVRLFVYLHGMSKAPAYK